MNKVIVATDDKGLQTVSVHGDFNLLDCGHILISLTNVFASKLGMTKTAIQAFVKFLEESETSLMLSQEGEESDV